MKTLKMFLVLAGLTVGMVVGTNAWAGSGGGLYSNSPDHQVFTEVFTSDKAATVITADNRIVGFTVVAGSSAGVAGLYDATTLATATNALVFDEAGTAANNSETVWYPFPKNLTTGLTVVLGDSDMKVVVYYE